MDNVFEELKQIFQSFRWIDDIPEDQNRRDKICLEAKAALLIEANCTSERFPAFIRLAEQTKGDKCYLLPEVVTMRCEASFYSDKMVDVSCDAFEVGKLNHLGKYWQIAPDLSDNSSLLFKPRYSLNWTHYQVALSNEPLRNFSDEITNAFYQKYPSLYSICKELTPYGTPEQICRYWGAEATPWGKIKPRGMFPDYIWEQSSLRRRKDMENWTDARLEQYAFRFLIPCQHARIEIFQLSNRYYENWYCHVFPFRNQYGETIMNVIKIYDPESQCKILLPLTTWLRNHSAQSQIFCVPYPTDKTPLYNLDLLLKEECQTVVLCDSIELADANQHAVGSGEIVFTSFICSPGKYEQVDWSSLQNKNVVMVVSNHSGIRLDMAALKAKELIEYLREEEELSPCLAIVPVEYGRERYPGFNNVDDILKRYQNSTPTVRQEDIRVLETEGDMEECFVKAEENLTKLPEKWWLKSQIPSEEKRIAEEKDSRLPPIDYIMRPLLVRGEAALIYAKKSVGKSSFVYSIAARVAASGFSSKPVPLLKGKWWSVPAREHKVLYLDFENMGAMKSKQEMFQAGYIPSAKFAECTANLIMKDTSAYAIDFSLPENHQKILDMIEDAKQNAGTPGKPVDLLVIDTYTGLVRTENPNTPANFKDLIDKIRKMGIAILITHHANSSNELRGLQSKLDKIALTIKLSRNEEKEDGNLDEQPCFIEYEYPRYPMCSQLKKPFEIIFDSKRKQWKLTDENHDENAELNLIVQEYKKLKFERDAICQMVGLQKSAYSERLKPFKGK